MNVTVNQEYLANALTAVGRAVSSRSTLPVLSNILLTVSGGTLALGATNLAIGIRVWISAVVAEPGAIHPRPAADRVRQQPLGRYRAGHDDATLAPPPAITVPAATPATCYHIEPATYRWQRN